MSTLFQSVTSNTRYLQFKTFEDIPNLQLWLDASDENTYKVNFYPQLQINNGSEPVWLINTSSQITVSPVSVGDLGNGDFTIEFWFYRLPGGSVRIIQKRNINGTAPGTWGIGGSNSGFYFSEMNDGTERELVSTGDVGDVTNTWVHVAVTRLNNLISIFLNGELKGQNIWARDFTNIYNMFLGFTPRSEGANGYLSNVRIIPGVSLYNGNFIPSIPLTVLPNTTFLALQSATTLQNYANPSTTFSGSTTFSTTFGALTASNNNKISIWFDKSPNALTATQSTVNNQTTLLSTEINNLNVINFDGTDDFLTLSTPIALSGNYSHFFVYKRPPSIPSIPVNVSLGNRIIDDQTPYIHSIDDNIYSSDRRTIAPTISATTLIGGLRKNEYLQVDLESKSFVTPWGGAKTASVSVIGIYRNGFYNKGPIGEIIHTSSMLPNYEVDLVNRKLYDKWKVAKVIPRIKINPIITTGTSTDTVSSTLGTWFVEPTSFRIEWQRSLNGINFTTIVNTLSTFTNPFAISVYNPTPLDYGYILRTSVSATNSVGTGVF